MISVRSARRACLANCPRTLKSSWLRLARLGIGTDRGFRLGAMNMNSTGPPVSWKLHLLLTVSLWLLTRMWFIKVNIWVNKCKSTPRCVLRREEITMDFNLRKISLVLVEIKDNALAEVIGIFTFGCSCYFFCWTVGSPLSSVSPSRPSTYTSYSVLLIRFARQSAVPVAADGRVTSSTTRYPCSVLPPAPARPSLLPSPATASSSS